MSALDSKDAPKYMLAGAGILGLVVMMTATAAGTAVVARRVLPAARRVATNAGTMIEDWIWRVLRRVSQHEGGYDSVQQNGDGQGVSYGIIQWTQRGGALADVLGAMFDADSARFLRYFGPNSPAMLLQLHNPDPDVRMRPVPHVAGGAPENLWSGAWYAALKAAGADPVFQQVQRQTAVHSDYMDAAREAAGRLSVYTERAVTLFYETAVHGGPGTARGLAAILAQRYASGGEGGTQRPADDRLLLMEYAAARAGKWRRPRRLEDGSTEASPSTQYGTNDRGEAWYNRDHTIRWVRVTTTEKKLGYNSATGEIAPLAEYPVQGSVWHAVSGSFDLYDDIVKNAHATITDPNLRDARVDFTAVARF